MPGGVVSTNRAMDPPLVFRHAKGALVEDVDGNEYIDYNCAFGAILLGHAHPIVREGAIRGYERTDLIGLGSTELEGELASALVDCIPSAEQVMLVNSGSEATQHALRLARAVTGRDKIVKFQGCYHGWYDYVSMNCISPRERIGRYDPMSAGMLGAATKETLISSFNDTDAFEKLLQQQGDDVAAVILEPIQHNVGAVVATQEFLNCVRKLTAERGIVLIFDEVITGFRHALGGYQSICGVIPDLTTLGKAVANGLPMGAVVGKRALIERCAPPPNGDVFLAGTFNGAGISIGAALATIGELRRSGTYERLFAAGDRMRYELAAQIERFGFDAQVVGYGSVWLVLFYRGTVRRYEDLLANDTALDSRFRRGLFQRGVLSALVPMKRYNISLSHTDEHFAKTLQAAEDTFKDMARSKRRAAS